MAGVPLYLVKVKSGDYKGRMVGPNIGGGLITNQELLANREVKVLGTKYSLYAQERGATKFFEQAVAGVQAELKQHGIETELVKVA